MRGFPPSLRRACSLRNIITIITIIITTGGATITTTIIGGVTITTTIIITRGSAFTSASSDGFEPCG